MQNSQNNQNPFQDDNDRFNNQNNFNENNHQENQFLNQNTEIPSYAEQMRAKNAENKTNQNSQDMAHNPYKAPESFDSQDEDNHLEMENDTTWYDTYGRIGRLRYLSYQIVMPTIISLALGTIAGIIGAVLVGLLGESATAPAAGLYVLAMLPGYFFQLYIIPKRRLHDLNKSSWFLLIMLIPLINIFFILYLASAAGTEGENEYGMPNRENQWWHYVLGLVIPVFYIVAILGILAAIALPAYQDYTKRAQQSQEQSIEGFPNLLEENSN